MGQSFQINETLTQNLSLLALGTGCVIFAPTAVTAFGIFAAPVVGIKAWSAMKLISKWRTKDPSHSRAINRIQGDINTKLSIDTRFANLDRKNLVKLENKLASSIAEKWPPPEKIASLSAEKGGYPSAIANYVLQKIDASIYTYQLIDSNDARIYAQAIIEAALTSALSDSKYFETLQPHLLIQNLEITGTIARNLDEFNNRLKGVETIGSAILGKLDVVLARLEEVKISDPERDLLQDKIAKIRKEKNLTEIQVSHFFETVLDKYVAPENFGDAFEVAATSFKELAEELNKRSNVSFDIQKDRDAAKDALVEQQYDVARYHLIEAANKSRVDAERAIEDYARSLRSLASLAFIELDYVEARKYHFEILSLSELSDEIKILSERPYLIASSAVINLAPNYESGRLVLEEMIEAGVKPNEVSFNTLINLAPNYETGRQVLEEMIEAGVKPNEVSFSTLINLAPNYETGRLVLEEMIEAGVKPDEVTLISLVKKALTIEQGCELAFEAREDQNLWYTGQGFYCALFSLPIIHLHPEGLLEIYNDLPFQWELALENPINQYRTDGKQYWALKTCLLKPSLSSALKFYREEYEFCHAQVETWIKDNTEVGNLHYCLGLAAHENGDWNLAKQHLERALIDCENDYDLNVIKQRLSSIPR